MSNRRNPRRGEKARVSIPKDDVGKIRSINPEHREKEKNSMRRVLEEWNDDMLVDEAINKMAEDRSR
jgi:hypothetical protein